MEKPAETEAQLKEKAEHISLYENLLKSGISLFEPDGNANGGVRYMVFLLQYFEKIESYDRCEVIKEWLKEYRKRWPYKPVKKKPAEWILTAEEEASLRLFGHYMADYRKLRRYRMECFDEQGKVIVVNKKNGIEELQDGRKFILDNLAFFEAEGEAYCLRICAELKPVLDEYDAKFKRE